MAPILIWRYVKLAKDEEKQMRELFGTSYQLYKSKTPRFLPKFKNLIIDLVRRLTDKRASKLKTATVSSNIEV